jgi:acetyl-CoA carboxylase carboxyltransferase component
MPKSNAKLFVNSPNAVEGNYAAKCDTATAEYQAANGVVDVVKEDEAEVLESIRTLISILPANNAAEAVVDCADSLNRAVSFDALAADPAKALADLSDNNFYFEVKADHAKEMVTAFIKLDGMTVGAVANRSEIYGEDGKVAEKLGEELSVRGCEKAADFINFCDAFSIPVLSLTNVNGFKATKCAEKGMAKAVAKLTYAFANATVPKVNVITKKAFGSAYVAMNSKAIGADVTFAWENAQIGTMDAKLAAKIMYDGEGAEVLDEKAKEYAALQNSALSAAKRGYVDYIITAAETRKYVIGAFEMLYSKREDRPAKKHGTV